MSTDNPGNIRLFIALPVPTALREQIAAVPRRGLESPRWTHPDDLHITLRFIGDIDPERVPDIESVLGEVRAGAFHIEVEGLDFFSNRAQTILYAGIKSARKLENLCALVTEKIQKAGFEFPLRPYIPHITLARLKKTRGLDSYIDAHKKKIRASWKTDRFVLYRSGQPDGTGKRYAALREYSLSPHA